MKPKTRSQTPRVDDTLARGELHTPNDLDGLSPILTEFLPLLAMVRALRWCRLLKSGALGTAQQDRS